MEKIYGKHRPLTDEMIQDLSKMGDTEFTKKWNTSRQYPIRARKKLGIKSFTPQHDLKPHRIIDNQEYKWCGAGHWELVENFGIHSSRYDGLRGHCREHANESSKQGKRKEYSSEIGKFKIRERNNRRKSGFILWDYSDQKRAMKLYENRCAYCGVKINFKIVEFDHFIPVSKGGKTVPSNMVPSCVSCNRGVGGKKAQYPLPWIIKKFGDDIGKCIFDVIVSKQKIIEQETKERVNALSFSEDK